MKGTQLASEIKYLSDYQKWRDIDDRGETWEESVKRVMNMHRNNPKLAHAFKNQRFVELFEMTEKLYLDKFILGSQRALQFGGEPIMKHNAKMFNCLSSYVDRSQFFQECCYWLLCGCGVGISVQKQHIAKLPPLQIRSKQDTKVFVIPDSIEGWSDAFGVLIQSYMRDLKEFQEYHGKKVVFDYSLIRPKGAMISGGFKAPGPNGLRKSLERCEQLLENHIVKHGSHNFTTTSPIVAYDYVMHMSDAVLSGGVRRSSCICLFSFDDKEMMEAKTYENFNPDRENGINQQRARSNNSVVLKRDECTKEMFEFIFERIKAFGEPGFYFVDDYDQATNPCVEIGMWPKTEQEISGWQGCNLATGNGAKLNSKEKLFKTCIGLAVMGTIQSTYTDFKYVAKESKQIFDREALLGCSITGWMNNPDILLNERNMQEGARLVVETNKEVAKILGINPAARTTCVKPEGNSSVLLETASGCHGEHSPKYFRIMQINKENEIVKYLNQEVPELIEESVWDANNQTYAVFIPVESKLGSVYKSELMNTNLLAQVKKIQQNWVEYGTNHEACIKPFLRHNVSNTVEVSNWDSVIDYLWENKTFFTGVSFLSYLGDRVYNQAPFTSVNTLQEIVEKYGDGTLFASGLIVDSLHEFDDLWQACELVISRNTPVGGTRQQALLRKDWIRRAKQFAKRYFKNDYEKMILCLKDVHLFHKWCTINRVLNIRDLNFEKVNLKPNYVDVDTMGAASCYNGACEIPEYTKKI